MRYFLVLALLAASAASNAQQPSLPKLNTPPGTTATVKSVTKSFNFYPLTRTVLLPWERLPLPSKLIPAGNTQLTAFMSPSPKVQNYFNNPSKYVPSFGTPKRTHYQSFKGKDGEGVIIYLEYQNKTPENAVEILSKYFFNTKTPPKPTESKAMEQFLVNEHTVIVWAFKETTSKVKEAHQEMIFNLISEVATKKK